jgi:hypothetical protein
MKFRPEGTIPELKEGQKHFCIRYIGFRVGFRIVVAAKDKKEAREYFNAHYSTYAFIHSIRQGTY